MPEQAQQKGESYEVGYKKPPKANQFSSTNQPKERATGTTLKGALRKELQRVAEDKGFEFGEDVLAFMLVEMTTSRTFNGETVTFEKRLKALNMVFDRIEGKPEQAVTVAGDKVIANLSWIGNLRPASIDGFEEADAEVIETDGKPENPE